VTPDLDVQGYFWLPDQSHDRLPGWLRFSTAEAGTLTLIGEFPDDEDLSRVVGEAEGRGYTLDDCFETFNERGKDKQVLRVQRVVVDVLYRKDEPNTADRVSLSLAGLTDWVAEAGFRGASPEGQQWLAGRAVGCVLTPGGAPLELSPLSGR
jgi:hypothetical protein